MRRMKAIVLGVLFLGLAAYGRVDKPELRNSQLHVYVYDDTGASQTVAEAEQAATRVFQKAGIAVAWVNCRDAAPAACAAEALPESPTVRIVSQPSTPQPGIFGVSFLARDGSGAYADVFLVPILKLQASAPRISLTVTLGDVIAHELGHLLLGSNAHSQQGIMQAHWEASQLHDLSAGHLLFTVEQAQRMRKRVATLNGGHDELASLAVVRP